MAAISEYSFPFDSVEVDGEPDREYLADEFAEYFRTFISSGTFMDIPTNLQVVANGDMTVTLKPGRMYIDGYRYKNTDDILIQISPADGVMNRIDRISATWSAEDRDIHYTLRQGTPAYKPLPPECRRDAEYKDYVVADIYVKAGVISVRQADITDRRLDSEVCGLAIPFYDIDTSSLYDQLNDFYTDFVDKSNTSYAEFMNAAEIWFTTLKQEKTTQISKIISDFSDMKDSTTAEFSDWLTGNTNNWEEEFFTWFNNLKEQLTDNVAINLQNQIGNLSELQTNAKGSLTAAVNELKGGAGMADVLKRWRTNSPSTTLNRRCRIATVTFTNTFAEAHYMIAVSEHEVNAGSAVFVWNIATAAVKNAVEKNTIDYLAICGKLITNKNTFYTEAVKSDSGVTFNLWCQPLENHNTFDLTLLNVSSNRGENESPLITNPAYESAETALPGEVSYPLLPSYSSISDIYGKTYVSMGRKPGTVVGDKSIAFGENVTATGKCSQAFGVDTIAGSEGQFVTGRLNTETLAGMSGYAVIVGGGANGIRKDIYTLDFDGNGFYERSVHARKEILSEQEIKVRKTYGMGGLDEYFLTKTMQLIESGGVYDGIVTLPLKEGRIYLLLTAEWNSSNDRVYGFRARMYTTPIGAGVYNLVAPTAGNLCASTNAGVTLGSVQTEDNYGITLKAGTNYTVSYFLYATSL